MSTRPRTWIPLVFLFGALALATPTVRSGEPAAPDLHRGRGYPGAQHFFTQTSATVVYPAGRGQDSERNRRSAMARAAFLEAQYGMKTRVAADVEATEAVLSDNLLVLGWENGLLQTKAMPRPFERSRDGIRFAGIEHDDPTADLLVFAPSPFAPERFVLLWTRIDPERDRFSVLPRVGSDWALYEEFLVVRQGMFLPGETWPHRRDEEAEADHRARLLRERGAERTRSTEHYEIHWTPGVVTPEELERIAASRERALSAAAAVLGPPPEPFRISLHVYPDEETKRARTGVPDPAHATPWSGELHMVLAAALTASPHEDAHLLARALYGPSYVSAIYEGIAIAVEDRVRGVPLEVAGALLHESGSLPSLSTLLDEESFRRLPESVRPTASGLLGAWIRATAPRERLAASYAIPRGEPAALAAAIGRSASQLEPAFRGWIAERAAARAPDVRFAKAEILAQERYVAGDWSGMAAALRQALEHRPNDPQTLFNLASAEMRADELDEAEKTLRRLLAVELTPAQSRFRVFSHYQLGRVYDLGGRREEALAEYEAVLRLPDESDAHRLAQERIRTPATREHLE